MGVGASAQVASGNVLAFDHASTGFRLDGGHLRAPCESCHRNGIFRGTPRACAICHSRGGLGMAEGMPPSHVPVSATCSSCHSTIAWTPANFRHRADQGVTTGDCGSCHNGSTAPGKSAGHPVTTGPCDTCHQTSAWLPAGYTHALAKPGECASCHNGTTATGKQPGHIPTTATCDTCHAAGSSFAPITVGIATLHASMAGPASAGNCSSCHGGGFVTQNAQTKPAKHVATNAQCDTCHKSSTTWATATFDHAAAATPVTGRCADCHGVSALGKPDSHVPTTQQCDACHTSLVAFKPATMNHVATAGQCVSCHNGAYNFANANAQTASHIPTTAQCDTCHVSGFVTWSPSMMNHTGMEGRCITCHSGGFIAQNAQTKPATHVATTAQCDTCHKSTVTWATATFEHAAASTPVAGRCSSCHNSTQALGKPTSHVPTGAQCDTCHAGFISFKPAQMNHTGLAGLCSTCHSGSYTFANAQARPVNHVPTSRECDSCHVSGFVAWGPAQMNHTGLAGLCSSCHNGTYLAQNAQVKPVAHVATTAQCDTCHGSTTTWATVSFVHAADAVGQCATCHNSVNALGKPTNHVPTAAQCDSCHSGYSAFKPARMNHAGTAGACAQCHSGTYTFVNALARSNSHIPTIASCDVCHTGGYVAWSPAVMNHAGLNGVCANCHSGGYVTQNAQTKPATHIATTAQCDTCHSSTTTWATATFNHAAATPAVAGRCSSCHNSVNALGRPTNHIPTTAQCDTCHTSFAAFAPAAMSHAATTGPVSAGNCAICHSGTYVFANARTKPATHITTSAQCDACHKSTVSWAGASYAHDAAAAGRCSECHNGSAALGRPTVHIPTTAQCDSCHTNFNAFEARPDEPHRALGPVRDLPWRGLHGGQCAGQAQQPHSDRCAVRHLSHQRFRRLRAGDDEPRGDHRAGVGWQLRHLPQRNLREAERADQTRDARRHHRAVRHLPQFDDDLGDSELQPRGGDAGGGRPVRELPQRHPGAGQADQPHSDDGAVRHLPHELRRVRAGDDEPRGDDGSGVGGQLRHLSQRRLRLRQRAGQAGHAHRDDAVVRRLPHERSLEADELRPHRRGPRLLRELPQRNPGAWQADEPHSDRRCL